MEALSKVCFIITLERDFIMYLSYELADYITKTNYKDLPEDVIHFTKLCLLDYFGSALAGSTGKSIHIIEELVQELGGRKQATLITGESSSVLHAAFFNAASSH